MAPFKTLKELFTKFDRWIREDLVQTRLADNDVSGRPWLLASMGYDKTLKLEDLRTLTDRSELNSEFVKRFAEIIPKSRKGISALKAENSAMHAFNRCFVQRYKGRIHFYRDDLSQKGQRNMRSAAHAAANLAFFKTNLD
jgi:hypothetical protein